MTTQSRWGEIWEKHFQHITRNSTLVAHYDGEWEALGRDSKVLYLSQMGFKASLGKSAEFCLDHLALLHMG